MAVHFKNPNAGQETFDNNYSDPASTDGFQELSLNSLDQSLFGVDINNSLGSEVVLTAEKKIKECLESALSKAANVLKVDVVRVENKVMLPLDIIVFTLSLVERPELGLAYHPVLIAATDDGQTSTNKDVHGQNVEVLHPTSERYGDREKVVVENELKKLFPTFRRLIEVDAEVLPRDYDFTVQEQMLKFTSNAVIACRNVLMSRAENWNDICIANIDRSSAGLVARTIFNRTGPQITNEVAAPIRSDIRLSLQTQEVRTPQGAIVQRAGPLAQIAGFVDLIFAPSQQAQPTIFGQPQMMQTQRYLPRFIMTYMEMLKGRSTGGQLIALLAAIGTYKDNTPLTSLYPKHNDGSKLDLNDIGALNIEANLDNNPAGGTRWKDLASGTASDGDILAYLRALVYPTFELALDVNDAGPDTWSNSIFVAAACGNATAINSIISAADRLCNGNFLPLVSPNEQICRIEGRVPMGMYQDATEKWRDVRDCAYLPVLNVFGERDFRKVEEWSNAKTAANMDADLSLYIQRRTSEAVLGPVVWTGVATRVVFNQSFLAKLSHAFAAAKGSINLIVQGERQLDQRSVYNVPSMMNSNEFTSHLAMNTTAKPNVSGGYYGQGRWGGV